LISGKRISILGLEEEEDEEGVVVVVVVVVVVATFLPVSSIAALTMVVM